MKTEIWCYSETAKNGMGLGAGSNAVADEKAVMDTYGYAHFAMVLYPAFSVLVVDIGNPLFMSIVGVL